MFVIPDKCLSFRTPAEGVCVSAGTDAEAGYWAPDWALRRSPGVRGVRVRRSWQKVRVRVGAGAGGADAAAWGDG